MKEKNKIRLERWKLLIRLERFLEGPMIFLGFIWLILIIYELTSELNPFLETIGYLIWGVFIIDFILSLIVAFDKLLFLKRNVLTLISLLIPAIRVLRVFRFIRLLRGLRLVKILSSVNRSMKSLAATMSKRGFGYMVLITLVVLFAGAAGMYAFEKDFTKGITSYGESLWWTAMIIITVGSEYWPQSDEGRILCFILALYGLAVLGYLTATIASFFIGQDVRQKDFGDKSKVITKEDIRDLKKLLNDLRNGK